MENRLSKILAHAGVASRRACEDLIFEGKVSVNGKPCLIPQTKVSLEKDTIVYEGQTISGMPEKIVYLLNKPRGYICSNQRVGSKKLIVDLFVSLGQRLFSVGRLDRDTSGLLLVTNDGDFAQQVIHPSANLVKEYLIKTEQEISHEHLIAMSKGICIDKKLVKPVSVKKVRKGTLRIAIKEGKKHEVRIIVAKAGLKLIELKRIRIGGLTLCPKLSEGQWRPLRESERRAIFN